MQSFPVICLHGTLPVQGSNSLLDKPMAAIGEAIDFKLSAGELGGLMDTLFGDRKSTRLNSSHAR